MASAENRVVPDAAIRHGVRAHARNHVEIDPRGITARWKKV